LALFAERRGFERYEFLQRLIETLKERHLEARMSTEWSRHDLEVASGPWTRLWLSTVTEELSEGKKILRCRLRTAWTWAAGLALGLMLGLVLLATGVLAGQSQWIWMSPLALPLLYFFFENDARRLRRLVALAVVEKARERDLVVIGVKESPTAPGQIDGSALAALNPEKP
jgi:hypothetical protein